MISLMTHEACFAPCSSSTLTWSCGCCSRVLQRQIKLTQLTVYLFPRSLVGETAIPSS